MQNEGGVIVVSVVINPLVNHCHVAIDLLAALLQGPVLSTLPAITLIGPANTHMVHFKAKRPDFTSTCDNLYLPGCHDDNEHILLPHHSPEVTVGVF